RDDPVVDLLLAAPRVAEEARDEERPLVRGLLAARRDPPVVRERGARRLRVVEETERHVRVSDVDHEQGRHAVGSFSSVTSPATTRVSPLASPRRSAPFRSTPSAMPSSTSVPTPATRTRRPRIRNQASNSGTTPWRPSAA